MSVNETVKRAYNPALPPVGMTDVLGEAIQPLTVESGGQVYRVGFPTQAAKGRYEQLVFEREKATVLRQKAFLPPEDYQARCDKLSEQIEGRQFATGQPMWLKYASSGAGWVMWVQSLIDQHHPGITFEQVVKLLEAKGDEVRLVLAAVVPSFFEWTLGLGEELAGRLDERSAARVRAEVAKARLKVPELLARSALS